MREEIKRCGYHYIDGNDNSMLGRVNSVNYKNGYEKRKRQITRPQIDLSIT